MTFASLHKEDLHAVLAALPEPLRALFTSDKWSGRVIIAGGFIRAVVAGEPINDVDLFTNSKEEAEELLFAIRDEIEIVSFSTPNAHSIEGLKHPVSTPNAHSIEGLKYPVQIILAWQFRSAYECIKSFDFTICQAAIYYEAGKWHSVCSGNFYPDLAAKRLRYTSPSRVETHIGGSLTRILKHYQRGYHIDVESLGATLNGFYRALLPGIYGAHTQKICEAIDPKYEPNAVSKSIKASGIQHY
jgi:hypothetical protein